MTMQRRRQHKKQSEDKQSKKHNTENEKKTTKKHNIICVGYHHTQENTT